MQRDPTLHLASALLLPLLACSSGSGPGVEGTAGGCQGDACGRGATSGRVGGTGGSSSATGGSTAGGTTSSAAGGGSSGSSGGSTSAGNSSGGGLLDCTTPIPLPDGGGCPHGYFVSEIIDDFSCEPISGATVQAIDRTGTPVSGAVITPDAGTFVLCGPPGPFSPFVTVPGYATTYLPEVIDGGYFEPANESLLTSSALAELGAFLPGGYDPSLGSVIVTVGASSNCPDRSGFVLSLAYGDGGAILDGGYQVIYFSTASLPDLSLTATTSKGDALFYGIDLSTSNFFTVEWSNDAGSCAPLLQSGTAELTGRIYVTDNTLSSVKLYRP